MTQFPDPNNPLPPMMLPYAQGSYGPPKLRPTSVTVLAVLGIIWGSLNLLGLLFQALQLAGVSMDPNNPVVKGMHKDPVLFAWSVFGALVNLVLGLLLLGGSIRSLSLKRSARSWLIAYSWMDIAFTLLSVVVGAAMVMPRIDQIVRSSNLNPSVQTVMRVSTWIGLLVSLVFLVFPGLILYFMSRPNVKEAFQRGLVLATQQWGIGIPPPPDGGDPAAGGGTC